MNENRYSYLVGSFSKPTNTNYVAQNPQTDFEMYVQDLIVKGQTALQQEEYTIAIQSFTEARAVILRTVHPSMPVDPNLLRYFAFPTDVSLVDTLINKAAEMLQNTSPVTYNFPSNLISKQSMVSDVVKKALTPISSLGLQITSYDGGVRTNVTAGMEAANAGDWASAIQYYNAALKLVPAADLVTQGSLQHDLGILNEKSGNSTAAIQSAKSSIDLFTRAKSTTAEAQALSTTSGIYARSGNTQQAQTLNDQMTKLLSTTNLNTVSSSVTNKVSLSSTRITAAPIATNGAAAVREAAIAAPVLAAPAVAASEPLLLQTRAAEPISATLQANIAAPQLMGLTYIAQVASEKNMIINGATSSASILVNANAAANTKSFLTTLQATKDYGLLTAYLAPTQTVAYLPHMYFYIIPMCMADCYTGMGSLSKAVQTYQSVLPYPYINQNYEIIKVWTRLAQAYLDSGDLSYRNAKDNTAAFADAKTFYENIVMTDKTLNNASPLYANAKFAGIKTRVTTALAAADPSTVNDNPLIISIVLSALTKLQQIKSGFNFFGFGKNYAPPFSFEYLQNTARYFAQQASQTEQRYIEYKSTAENEQFKRDQVAQQADVAYQSVILEQRGADEAAAGIKVANQSLNYANVQANNDQKALAEFTANEAEQRELEDLNAWASASAVDHDDEVQLTISGYSTYSSDHKPRNQVLQDLADKRTRLSQQQEEDRLKRALDASNAYIGVAQAQVADAQARKAIADQRVVVAKLQQKYAEENRDFQDMEEFGASLWYELGQQAKKLMQRYLDMATEIAFLMERAYNAETERGLHVIRYDYQHTSSDNLMGADMLTADIDYFTYDHVTTTKSKKIPVKRTISLADSYPSAFQSLKAAGVAYFDTALADFDRYHPGLYLAKMRNVEIVFVGVAGLNTVSGSLRNVGVSRFRQSDGTIVPRHYPADVMVFSQYQLRQDSLSYRITPNDLRLFENNGIDTLWELRMPQSSNDFDFADILDVQLVFYYDGFFDATLEANITAALPASGEGSKGFSLQLSFPDELFYLKNQGNAALSFDATMFPFNQKDMVRKSLSIKLAGTPVATQNVTIHLKSDLHPAELVFKTDANGLASDATPGSPLGMLLNLSMVDNWQLSISAADNPQLVQNGKLDLSGLTDVSILSDYTFNYK